MTPKRQATDARAALLDGLVDYAGLFPPAALGMPDAVARYAAYAAGPDRAMLGRFVLPVARLDECVAAIATLPTSVQPRLGSHWTLSVLAGAGDVDALAVFNARHADVLLVDTVEAKADDAHAIEAIAAALRAFTTFVEIAVRDDPSALIAAIGARGLRAKIRTGGVTAEAFPSPAEVLRFLEACVRAQVPFKATAGLHHPLRGEYALTYAPDAPRGTMYGFLNVFLAATFLHAGAPANVVAPLLEERDATAIRIDDASVRWRDLEVTASQVARARASLAGSFGSCSFEEPVQDLTSLQLT